MLIARCTPIRHVCREYISKAFASKRPVAVIHLTAPGVVSVQVHVIPSHRELSPRGMSQIVDLLAEWHVRGFFSLDAIPKTSFDSGKCRWQGLKLLTLPYVLSDLEQFITEASHTMPRRLSQGVFDS